MVLGSPVLLCTALGVPAIVDLLRLSYVDVSAAAAAVPVQIGACPYSAGRQ